MSHTPLDQAIFHAHDAVWDRACEAAAVAPASVAWLGDFVAPTGGVALASAVDLKVAVAVHRFGREGVVKVHAAGDHPIPEATRVVESVLAAMSSRQMLPREVPSLAFTVVSDIPTHEGLGAVVAASSATLLAVSDLLFDEDSLPPRSALADVTALACRQLPIADGQWWRAVCTFRGREHCIQSIVHSDEAVNSLVFEDEREHLNPMLYIAPTTQDDSAHRAWLLAEADRDNAFLVAACEAFGVPTLRDLPQAPQRVLEWLEVMRRNRPEEEWPDAGQATRWLQLCGRDSARARQAAREIKSRHAAQMRAEVHKSAAELAALASIPTPTQSRIVEALAAQGVAAARPVPGGRGTVLALLPDGADISDLPGTIVSASPAAPAHLLTV